MCKYRELLLCFIKEAKERLEETKDKEEVKYLEMKIEILSEIENVYKRFYEGRWRNKC